MSKLQWIGCLVFAAALAAPALSADEPTFPQPAPTSPDTPPQPPKDPAPRSPEDPPKSPEYPAPKTPGSNPDAPAPAPRDDDATMPPTAPAEGRQDRDRDPSKEQDQAEAPKNAKNASTAAAVSWTGNSLMFEQARFQGEARLYARSKDSKVWQVYRGQDLE